MSDLLEHLAAGIDCIHAGDTSTALAHLRYCEKLDPTQCDVWIATAAAHGETDHTVLKNLVNTKHTYDQCLRQLDERHAQIIVNRAPHLPLGFAGLQVPVFNVAGIELAYAASLAQGKQFAKADTALGSSDSDEARTVRTWLLHSSGRFTDVLSTANPLLASDNDIPVLYGHLFVGIAHAHLGNFGAAREHLLAILPTESVRVNADAAAEAAYWIALTYRHESDPESAAQFLQRALSFSPQNRFQQALADDTTRIRVTSAELIARRTSLWDVATEPTLAQAQAAEMATKRGGLLEQGRAELDSMIGMTEVKDDIRRHCGYIRGLQARAKLGISADKASTHLVFAGPPGTGKTTVAHIVAKIYAGLGITKTDKVVIAGRGDFEGQYWGHTIPKVKAKLQDALDGVLFIDEAYALVADTGDGGGKDSFGSQIVTEIVAFMEANRDRIVVIIAGYANDIDRVLETNAGWRSRFTTRFDFRSYNIDELLQMAQAWCEREDYVLAPAAEAFIRAQAPSLFGDHYSGRTNIDRLGNGRFIRNLMETASKCALAAVMETALTGDVGADALRTLTSDAVEDAYIGLLRKELGGS